MVAASRRISLDDVARLRTRARKTLQGWAPPKHVKRLLAGCDEAPTREHEAATLRCLAAAAETIRAWDFGGLEITIAAVGIVVVEFPGGPMAWHHGEPLAAWRFLVTTQAVREGDGIWLLRVDESGEVVAQTSRRDLP